jgi:hypothetical protein
MMKNADELGSSGMPTPRRPTPRRPTDFYRVPAPPSRFASNRQALSLHSPHWSPRNARPASALPRRRQSSQRTTTAATRRFEAELH